MSSDTIYGKSTVIRNKTFGLKDSAASTLGLVEDITVNRAFGCVSSLTTDYQVFAMDTNLKPWLVDVAETVTVTSDDGSECATAVVLVGLNATWDEIIEVVVMGATSVQTFLRVNTCLVAGTTDTDRVANSGTISVKQSTSDDLLAQVPVTEGRSVGAVFTVPRGQTAAITRAIFSIPETSSEVITVRACYVKHDISALPVAGTPLLSASTVFVPSNIMTDVELDAGFIAEAGTDVILQVKAAAAVSVHGAGYFDLLVRTTP